MLRRRLRFSLSADAEHAALLIYCARLRLRTVGCIDLHQLEASQPPSLSPCNAQIANGRDPATAAEPARRLNVRFGGAGPSAERRPSWTRAGRAPNAKDWP